MLGVHGMPWDVLQKGIQKMSILIKNGRVIDPDTIAFLLFTERLSGKQSLLTATIPILTSGMLFIIFILLFISGRFSTGDIIVRL